MVAGTWTRTHDLLTKFLEDFYNLLSFSMLKVLARHLNFQTVTFCVAPIFVSFHRHQIWWKNNFILIWLLSFSFYLEQKSAFWLWKRKMQSRRTSSPTPTGFITAETFRPKFRKIREKIISSFLSKFRDCLGFGLARSLRSVFGSRRKIPKLNRVCWIFFSFRLWRWDNLWESLLNRFQVNFGMQSRILSPSPSLHCETMAWFNEAASDL